MQRVFAAAGVEPRQKLAEFRVSPENMLAVGDQLAATHFVAGQYVDVTAVSQGKGFAGSIKRHGFGGGRATHGVSVSHRAHGSTGQNQDPRACVQRQENGRPYGQPAGHHAKPPGG